MPAGGKTAKDAIVVPYTVEHAPDTQAARFWLMNRQRHLWKEKQEIEIADPLASLSPEQRLAKVVDVMARARALLAQRGPDDDDEEVIDADYEDVSEEVDE